MTQPNKLGQLILEVLRLHGVLTTAGDELVHPLGLTSARWHVLGAVANAPSAQPASHLARSLGLSRQGVQRIVNELMADGFVAFQKNPHHRRAQLVTLTQKGSDAYRDAMNRRSAWIDGLSSGLSDDELENATDILRLLEKRIVAKNDEPGQQNS